MQQSNGWVKEGNSDLSADKLDEVFNHVKIENKEVGLDTSTGHFYSGYLIVGIFYWQVYYVLVKYIYNKILDLLLIVLFTDVIIMCKSH